MSFIGSDKYCDLINHRRNQEELIMKENIDISIIVPHYNSFELLKILLDSLEIHDNIQIIVVDDHSEDRQEFTALCFQYPYVEFLENHNPKHSAGICRNIGLECAKGKWILFADADDYFEDNFYNIVEQYIDAEEDMIVFAPISRSCGTKEIADRHLKYEEYVHNYAQKDSLDTELALRYKFETPWSKMIKREVIQKNKIEFDDCLVSNDVMFSVKCGYYCKKICAIEQRIYCVTKGENTLTTNKTKERQSMRIKVFCNVYEFLKTRLTKEQLKHLNYRGAPIIYNLWKDRSVFGYAYIIKIYFILLKKGIPVITLTDCKRLLCNKLYVW